MKYSTEQEEFWAGDFGSDYIERNQGDILLASNLNFFSKSLNAANKISSCIEFGSNIGMNLKALKLLRPGIEIHAIEINVDAANKLSEVIPKKNIYHTSILNFTPKDKFDLVLIKGVLIHIDPIMLPKVYENLFHSCNKYLMVAEYYNPVPVSIPYRGYEERLFKRDFAGEIMERYPQLKLIDYGFSYHRDPNFPQDDITWFLMEKTR